MIADRLPIATFYLDFKFSCAVKITVYREYFAVEHFDVEGILRNRLSIEPGKLSGPEQFIFALILPYIFNKGIAYDEELGFHKL